MSEWKEYKLSDFPRISPLEDDLDIIWKKWHNKYKMWEYEEEFRIIWSSLNPNKELTKEARILHFPNDYVKEVMLGLNADDKTRSEIACICKEKGWPLYQIDKVPWKYEIDRVRVQ